MNTIDHTTKTVDAQRTNGSTSPATSRFEHDTGRLLRRVLAGFLAIHGFAHLVGTTEAVTAIGDDTSVDYLFGQWTLTDTAVLVGAAAVWAPVAVGFALVGVATWIETPRWLKALVAITSVSLVLCLVALPQAAIGAVINVALLAIAITSLNRQPDRST